MADADQAEYVADLVIGAQQVLKNEGKAGLAEKVHRLFITDRDPQADVSIGMVQFELLLARARVADLERIKRDPSAIRLEVEHAMILTLQKNDIALPKSFMTVANNFKPKFPLKTATQPAPPSRPAARRAPPTTSSPTPPPTEGFGDLLGPGGFVRPPQ